MSKLNQIATFCWNGMKRNLARITLLLFCIMTVYMLWVSLAIPAAFNSQSMINSTINETLSQKIAMSPDAYASVSELATAKVELYRLLGITFLVNMLLIMTTIVVGVAVVGAMVIWKAMGKW